MNISQNRLRFDSLQLTSVGGGIDMQADVRLLGFAQQPGPARLGWHEEDPLGLVFVLVLGVGAGAFAFAGLEFGVQNLEGVGDVLEEDEAEHHVLVLGGVDVLAQLVGGLPELLFQRLRPGFFLSFASGHRQCSSK